MNKNLSVKEIIKCTKGEKVVGNDDEICTTFSRDTRKIKEGDTYIGIKGKKFNGNKLWEEALKNGAKVAIVQDIEFSEEQKEKYKNKTIIKVQNTRKALQKMAEYKRSLYGKNFPVIAVTGSVGKTSTKDIIANILSQKYKVLKTEGNKNNEIGLPFTILKLQDHDVAVIEMGMNHLGEISVLSQIVKPTISVITNIGTSHIGNLGSRENILKAKLEILDGMENPYLIINNDNDMLHKWKENASSEIKIKTFGIKNKSDAMAENINLNDGCSSFTCNINGEKFEATIPVGGEHFVLNSICASLVGNILDVENEKIKQGIEKFKLTKNRMEIKEVSNNIKIIDDCYNASYESMKVVLKYMEGIKEGRKIAVLGDMLELGEYSKELHKKVGKEVAKNKIDILVCCGEESKYIVEEAIKNGIDDKNVYYTTTLKDTKQILKKILKAKDNVLIKASNGMKFSELVSAISNQ